MRSHKKKFRGPNEEAQLPYHTGVDYWKQARLDLAVANKEFARRMNGDKYEDEERRK